MLSWLATRLVEETEAFLEWEKGIVGAPAGSTGAAPGGAALPDGTAVRPALPVPRARRTGATRPAAAQTVPGDVVR